jgi:hypothetical protein
MAQSYITLREALETQRLEAFVAQERRVALVPSTAPILTARSPRLLKRSNQKIEHRIPHLTEIRAERELAEVTVQMLRANVDMRSVN